MSVCFRHLLLICCLLWYLFWRLKKDELNSGALILATVALLLWGWSLWWRVAVVHPCDPASSAKLQSWRPANRTYRTSFCSWRRFVRIGASEVVDFTSQLAKVRHKLQQHNITTMQEDMRLCGYVPLHQMTLSSVGVGQAVGRSLSQRIVLVSFKAQNTCWIY